MSPGVQDHSPDLCARPDSCCVRKAFHQLSVSDSAMTRQGDSGVPTQTAMFLQISECLASQLVHSSLDSHAVRARLFWQLGLTDITQNHCHNRSTLFHSSWCSSGFGCRSMSKCSFYANPQHLTGLITQAFK